MKAILVIDIDDEFGKEMRSCDFVVTDRYGSNIIYPTISFSPMPQKESEKRREEIEDWTGLIYSQGWNACINEILGDTEDE